MWAVAVANEGPDAQRGAPEAAATEAAAAEDDAATAEEPCDAEGGVPAAAEILVAVVEAASAEDDAATAEEEAPAPRVASYGKPFLARILTSTGAV